MVDIRKKNIALITPVKNEIDNLPELIYSIEQSSYPISLWIIIDDASNDGSGEYLDKNTKKLNNVETVKVVHATHLEKDYRLGSKYSQVIDFGFKTFNDLGNISNKKYDFIGILDADCFVEKEYYEKLIKRFAYLPKLGIASGVIYYRSNGALNYDKMPVRWCRGAIRLWRMECFKKSGYLIGPSADAISTALAWTNGWESQSFKDIKAESREMGARINPQYYGETAYYRYNTLFYIFLKFFIMCFRDGIKVALTYVNGYLNARKRGIRINVNNKVKTYFRLLLFRNVYENFIVLKNYLKLSKKTE